MNFLFPNSCPLCGESIGFFEPICEACRADILGRGPSYWMEEHRRYRIHAFSNYEGKLSEVIKLYKYHEDIKASSLLVDVYLKLFERFPPTGEVITWVPSSRDSLERRGYDHMAKLARSLSKKTGIPHRKILVNVSKGRQVERSGRDRKEMGRFRILVPPAKRVVLLDDVLTTGTSVKDCVKTLLSGGAEYVEVYVLMKG